MIKNVSRILLMTPNEKEKLLKEILEMKKITNQNIKNLEKLLDKFSD